MSEPYTRAAMVSVPAADILALAAKWEAAMGQRVPIDREGTCDGCSEGRRLVASYPTPDSEPWLCQECDDEGRREIIDLRALLQAVSDAVNDEAPPPEPQVKPDCAFCGHYAAWHRWKDVTRIDCGGPACGCTAYEAPESVSPSLPPVSAEEACNKCGHPIDSPDGCSECPSPSDAEVAWLKWVYENADTFNTDRLSFLAGWAAKEAGE